MRPNNTITPFNNFSNYTYIVVPNLFGRPPVATFDETWFSPLVSIDDLIFLISGLAFLINGLILLSYLNDENKKEAKHEVYLSVLSGDEKLIYSLMKKYDGELTQKEIASKLQLSTLRTHRAINRLSSKGIISVASFGMTNKIFLKESKNKEEQLTQNGN